MSQVKTEYQSEAVIMMLPPGAGNKDARMNPFINLDNNMVQLALAMTTALNSAQTESDLNPIDPAVTAMEAETVKTTGASAGAGDTVQVRLSATADNGDAAKYMTQRLIDYSARVLRRMQDAAGVRGPVLADIVVVVPPTAPEPATSSALRSIVSMALLGIIVAAAIIGAILGVLQLRSRSRGTRNKRDPGTPKPGAPAPRPTKRDAETSHINDDDRAMRSEYDATPSNSGFAGSSGFSDNSSFSDSSGWSNHTSEIVPPAPTPPATAAPAPPATALPTNSAPEAGRQTAGQAFRNGYEHSDQARSRAEIRTDTDDLPAVRPSVVKRTTGSTPFFRGSDDLRNGRAASTPIIHRHVAPIPFTDDELASADDTATTVNHVVSGSGTTTSGTSAAAPVIDESDVDDDTASAAAESTTVIDTEKSSEEQSSADQIDEAQSNATAADDVSDRAEVDESDSAESDLPASDLAESDDAESAVDESIAEESSEPEGADVDDSAASDDTDDSDEQAVESTTDTSDSEVEADADLTETDDADEAEAEAEAADEYDAADDADDDTPADDLVDDDADRSDEAAQSDDEAQPEDAAESSDDSSDSEAETRPLPLGGAGTAGEKKPTTEHQRNRRRMAQSSVFTTATVGRR